MPSKLNKGCKASNTTRDAGGFVALPWAVLDCPAYGRLSAHARALLLEVARQYVRDNNGKLLLTRDYMAKRGWKSSDTLTKAKRELLEGGFIYETVMGHRPNKASWYAVTWHELDRHPGYDAGAVEGFRRGAYRDADPLPKPKPTREELYRKWDATGKNAPLRPPHGTEMNAIAPPHGTETPPTVPPHGAMEAILAPLSVPPHGHHLDMPSTAEGKAQATTATPIETLSELWAKVGCRSQLVKRNAARLAIARQSAADALAKHAKPTHVAASLAVAGDDELTREPDPSFNPDAWEP